MRWPSAVGLGPCSPLTAVDSRTRAAGPSLFISAYQYSPEESGDFSGKVAGYLCTIPFNCTLEVVLYNNTLFPAENRAALASAWSAR